jgi:hypothetical protein
VHEGHRLLFGASIDGQQAAVAELGVPQALDQGVIRV